MTVLGACACLATAASHLESDRPESATVWSSDMRCFSVPAFRNAANRSDANVDRAVIAGHTFQDAVAQLRLHVTGRVLGSMDGRGEGLMNDISVIIPTLDEEPHIGRAVASASTLGPVFVVDSGSRDRTCEIAAGLGAAAYEHPWQGYSAQKNWALDNLPIRTPWVLFLDADEFLTAASRQEIEAAVKDGSVAGFHLPRRNIFMGRLLRYAWWYPDYQLRLFRLGAGRFEDRLVHEHVVVEGRVGFLKQPILHENLKGIDAFMARHLRYATLEAEEIRKARRKETRGQRKGSVFASWPERRRWFKVNVWYRIPGRPAIRFAWMYFLKRGFLDGRQGLAYCELLASYEALIDAKLLELEARSEGAAAKPLAPPDFLRLLVCPACRGSLEWSPEHLCCNACTRAYPITDGIPVLLLDGAAAEHDELEHHHDHKHRQAAFFDREEAAEFEITRPHGAPGLYGWLLGEKFCRSVTGLRAILPGATVLTVCGGSGMDADFLAGAGARVISSDISLGAARRARERARRFGLTVTPIVADVEHLPFADRAVDLVYVHDGLHHLEQPATGLAEMARVAARAVSVTEPARALVTALAVRLGLALEREEAGNRVARVTLEEMAAVLETQGFQVVHGDRYAMYYQHEPGRVCAALSAPGVFALSRAAWRLSNRLAGRLGNKLTVQAVRP